MDAELTNWPCAIDVRPLLKEDVFQQPPLKYAVNNNRYLYIGLDNREELKEEFQERANKLINELDKYNSKVRILKK